MIYYIQFFLNIFAKYIFRNLRCNEITFSPIIKTQKQFLISTQPK